MTDTCPLCKKPLEPDDDTTIYLLFMHRDRLWSGPKVHQPCLPEPTEENVDRIIKELGCIDISEDPGVHRFNNVEEAAGILKDLVDKKKD